MYEELVEEFEFKKSATNILEIKDSKISNLTLEINKLKSEMNANDQYITSFKRELGNIASSMIMGKELEEVVRLLYKKYVRGEKVAIHSTRMGCEGALSRVTGDLISFYHFILILFFYYFSSLIFCFSSSLSFPLLLSFLPFSLFSCLLIFSYFMKGFQISFPLI